MNETNDATRPLAPARAGTLVAIDGEVMPLAAARVPVTDRGFLYGDSVFETFRSYGRRAHALDRHLARLERSAAALEIALPVGPEALREEVRGLLGASEDERRVRLMVTRGDAAALADEGARRVILAAPFAGHPLELYARGVEVCLVQGARSHAQAKAGSYLVSVLAAREARARGAYEAILVDGEDVLEGATSNVFVVSGDVLRTPAAGVLPGVTRGIVLELAADVGLRVEEGPLEVEALRGADEAFLTSSTREVMPIRAVDGAALGSGEVGPKARALLERYRETVPSRLD